MPQHLKKENNRFTSAGEVFSWFESFTNLEAKTYQFSNRNYRLDRMQYLLELCGNPQQAYSILHVAGSKAKGSTAALLAGAITEGGFKCGLYTSPHVQSYLERITVSMQPPREDLITSLGNQLHGIIRQINLKKVSDYSRPTTFELLTILALLYFREAGCRYAVLEAGLGGRLDATNVVKPLAAVITPVELEHTEILGNTLEQIAGEKAGIIKSGIPVFCSYQQGGVAAVIRQQAAARQAELFFLAETTELSGIRTGPGGTRFSLKLRDDPPVKISLQLIGHFQAENSALAYLVLKTVLPGLAGADILKGFAKTRLPGRMELFPGRPEFVFDGAHTPVSVDKVCRVFKQLFPGETILIFGSIIGKEHAQMAAKLASCFRYIIISTPGTFKESEPTGVYKAFRELNGHTMLEPYPARAYELALDLAEGKRAVLVTGSFYMVAEIRQFLV